MYTQLLYRHQKYPCRRLLHETGTMCLVQQVIIGEYVQAEIYGLGHHSTHSSS